MRYARYRYAAVSAAAYAAIVPYIASAQTTFKDLAIEFVDVLNDIIKLLVGAGVVVFLWGLAKFISVAGDEKSHRDGKYLMVWGLVGIFVMTFIWGIIGFFMGEFGFGGAAIRLLPE